MFNRIIPMWGLPVFDADTEEFLKALSLSTGKLYSVGLQSFQEFYGSVGSGSLKDFLDRVEADQRFPWLMFPPSQ